MSERAGERVSERVSERERVCMVCACERACGLHTKQRLHICVACVACALAHLHHLLKQVCKCLSEHARTHVYGQADAPGWAGWAGICDARGCRLVLGLVVDEFSLELQPLAKDLEIAPVPQNCPTY